MCIHMNFLRINFQSWIFLDLKKSAKLYSFGLRWPHWNNTHSVPDPTPVSFVREVHPSKAFVRVTSASYQKQPEEVTENHADFKWSSKHKHTHRPHFFAGHGHCETV